jgi:hypothetical protein
LSIHAFSKILPFFCRQGENFRVHLPSPSGSRNRLRIMSMPPMARKR